MYYQPPVDKMSYHSDYITMIGLITKNKDNDEYIRFATLWSRCYNAKIGGLDIAYHDDNIDDDISYDYDDKIITKYKPDTLLTSQNNIEYATEFIKAFILNKWDFKLNELSKLHWGVILVRIILTRPVNDKQRVSLDTELFTVLTFWDDVFGAKFTSDFRTYYGTTDSGTNIFLPLLNSNVPLLNTYNKIVYDKQNDTYKKYKLIKTLLESKDILKISIEPIEEFIVLQPTVNINAYLKIVGGLFNEKTEIAARELKGKMIKTITSELDSFMQEYTTTRTTAVIKLDYYKKFIEADIFDTYIASYSVVLFKKFKAVMDTNRANDDVANIIYSRMKNADTKYKNYHLSYTGEKTISIGEIKTTTDKPDPEYEEIKPQLLKATKLLGDMQIDYSRIMQFKNVCDASGVTYDISGVKQYIKDNVIELQKYVKKLTETESFLKDKKINENITKDHQFSLDIKALTNVLNNQEFAYTPKMTVQTAGGDLFFSVIHDLHPNVIAENPTKDPLYLYTQFTAVPSFKSLIDRNQRGYPLDGKNVFEEYSKTIDKKRDPNAINNIEIVLDTFFNKNAPFFVGSERYTVFKYEWDKDIEKITKNGKKETYGDEEPVVPTSGSASGSTSGSTGGPTSGPSSMFGSETGEAGFLRKTDLTKKVREHTEEKDDNPEDREAGFLRKTDVTKKVRDHTEDSFYGEGYETGGLKDTEYGDDDNSVLKKILQTLRREKGLEPIYFEDREVGDVKVETTIIAPAVKKGDSDASEKNESGKLVKDDVISPVITTPINPIISETGEIGTLVDAGKKSGVVVVPTTDSKKDVDDDISKKGPVFVEGSEIGELAKNGAIASSFSKKVMDFLKKPDIVKLISDEERESGVLKKGVKSGESGAVSSDDILAIEDINPSKGSTTVLSPTSAITSDNILAIEDINPLEFLQAIDGELNNDKNDNEFIHVLESLRKQYINTVVDKPNFYNAESYRKLVRIYVILKILENEKRVSIINFKSIYTALGEIKEQYDDSKALKVIDTYGGQVGGGTALYIDIGEEIRSYADQLRDQEAEIKKLQAEEVALLKKDEDPLKADIVPVVSWKYYITIQLYLYPGDKIPLSAMASLACSIKRNDIYKMWRNIKQNMTVKKKADDVKKKKEYNLIGPYVPVSSHAVSVKKKDEKTPAN